MTSTDKKPLLGQLYSLPPTSYTRMKFFLAKADGCLKRGLDIMSTLSQTDALKETFDEIHRFKRELKSPMQVLVCGNVKDITLENIVQRNVGDSKVPIPVYDLPEEKKFWSTIDMVVYVIHAGSALQENVTGISTIISSLQSEAATEKFLLLDSSAKHGSKLKRTTPQVSLKLKEFLDEEPASYVSSMAELPKHMSTHAELIFFQKLEEIDKDLQNIQNQLYSIPSKDLEENLEFVLSNRRHIDGWKKEFEEEMSLKNRDCDLMEDEDLRRQCFTCLHKDKHRVYPCLDCYILHRAAHALGMHSGNIIFRHKSQENGSFKTSALLEKTSESIAKEITPHLSDMLFDVTFSSQAVEIKKFGNRRVRNYIIPKIINICKEKLSKIATDLTRLRYETLSLFAQSELDNVKAYPKSVLDPPISDEISSKLFKSVRSVKGLGHRFGTIQVEIEEQDYKENGMAIEYLVRTFFKARNISSEKINIVPSSEISKHTHAAVVGSPLQNTIGQVGSLGGFADMIPIESSPDCPEKLCALVSNHIVHKGNAEVFLLVGGKAKAFVRIGRTLSATEQEGLFDIAAVQIDATEVHVPELGRQFKDSNGTYRECQLYDYSDETGLRGRTVHIFGCKSKPGVGVVSDEQFRRRVKDEELCNLVVIEDSLTEASIFSKPGDSGSIVLSDEPDEIVSVISMLIGKQTDNQAYVTFRIEEGLESLSRRVTGNPTFRLS